MKTKALTYAGALVALALSCSAPEKTGWSDTEKAIISGPVPARVLTAHDSLDLKILRDSCGILTVAQLLSDEYCRLAELLVSTVTDPSQDGVGIAAPQIGISRRVIAVQRFDKAGEPFEVYPNIRITAVRGAKEAGPEGCLSVPGYRGIVERWQEIDICYNTACGPEGAEGGTQPEVRDTTETVKGYTAVIFQHECDHLDGVLYVDKAISLSKDI